MVRDLILNMSERDLSMCDKSNPALPVFDSVWGNIFDEDSEIDALICNIIIPEAYWSMVQYDNGEFVCRFQSHYIPDTRHFRVRVVALQNGSYKLFGNLRGTFGTLASSYAINTNVASPIAASMLPYINIDGMYLVRFVCNSGNEALYKAYIYSAYSTDINVSFSDDQASQLLSLCAPGKSYRYPTTGVGITNYLNCVVAHSDLEKVLDAQFEGDGKPLVSAVFDNESGRLDVICQPEQEVVDDSLEDIANLNIDFFSQFSDEFVRKNVVLDELNDVDFLELLNGYSRVLNLILFTDQTTTTVHIANKVEAGRFDSDGNVVPSNSHFIVSATLDANTIIMFDDEEQDNLTDAPVFIIDDVDQTRLYTALVEQPYWITQACHKCFILKKRATVKYMIRQERFRDGKGLFIVPSTSENIKNMLGLVQDENTGRLLGIVSNNTNISDMTLEEVTQHIYATQITN